MYSTSSEHTHVPWAAHSYNVAFSDEIGHFAYCSAMDANGNYIQTNNGNDPGSPDDDDFFCFPPSASSRIQIGKYAFRYSIGWKITLSQKGYNKLSATKRHDDA
jgi:hypothetical protein